MLYFIIVGGVIVQLDDISKGDGAELEVRYNGRTMNFRSDIVQIKTNAIFINPITVNDQTVGFSDKCQISFLHYFEGKINIWENVIVKLVRFGDNIFHKIELYGEGKPYNRRESFRMYIGDDMPLYVNTAGGPTAIQVLVKDISTSGFAFITTQEIDQERIVRLKLKSNFSFHSLSAVIVRKEFITHLDSFLYGCKFNEKYEFLGKYIAQKQGELLKKKTSNLSSPPTRDRRNKTSKDLVSR